MKHKCCTWLKSMVDFNALTHQHFCTRSSQLWLYAGELDYTLWYATRRLTSFQYIQVSNCVRLRSFLHNKQLRGKEPVLFQSDSLIQGRIHLLFLIACISFYHFINYKFFFFKPKCSDAFHCSNC